MKNQNDNKNKRLLKIGLSCSLSVLAIVIGYNSFAASGISSDTVWDIPYSAVGSTPLNDNSNLSMISGNNFALNSAENSDYVAIATNEAEQAALAKSTQCADINNADGLGSVQKEHMDNERKKDLASVDLDKIFKIGKQGGCFNALNNFVDLSVMIPSIASIADSVKKTLVTYATRKVCNVVDNALQGALEPVKGALDNVSSRGQLDLSGRINKEVSTQLYGIDTDLGRASKPADASSEIQFKW